MLLYLFMSIMQLSFVMMVWPLDSVRGNFMEIFNEGCVLVCGYHLLLFTDFVEDPETKWRAGWSLLGLVLFNILLNITVCVFDFMSQIGDYLSEHCSKKNYKRNKNRKQGVQHVRLRESHQRETTRNE